MAKDLTLKSSDGSTILYPKTVTDLVFDNESGTPLKEILNYPDMKITSDDITAGKFRVNNGSIASNDSFFYSNPIEVKAGYKFKAIDISSYSAQTAIAMLSWVDENNNFVSKILNPDGAGSYEYTFDKGGYIGISGHIIDLSKFSIGGILVKDKVISLETDVSKLKEEIEKMWYYIIIPTD